MQFIPMYIKRKHGKEEVVYDHPLLEPILKETNGIIVYQEQIQQAAQTLAGFTLGEGDILRRAMGKKKPEVMDQQRGKFVTGCKDTNDMPRSSPTRFSIILPSSQNTASISRTQPRTDL